MSADVTFFESVPYFTLQSSDIASESIPLLPPIPQSALALIPTVSTPVSQSETTRPSPTPKSLQVFTRRPTVLASVSILDDSYLVEGPPPQPSATPSDLDVPIAL